MYIPGLRNKAGYVVISDPEPSGRDEYETYQCCHCNAHYKRLVGKGPPAMCLMCNKPTCGKRGCDPCTPFEKKLEERERRYIFQKQLDGS